MLSVPALSQEGRIYIRREIVEAYLWDRIFFMNRSGKKALNRALSGFGVTEEDPSSLKRHLPEIVRNQIETHIFHELGEILDPAVDRKAWRELLAAFPNTVIELLARTLKDLLADTSVFGTLPCIVRERDKTSLDLFAAFFDGLRRVLCPEMIEAYEKFSARQDWDLIAEAIRKVYTTSRKRAGILMDIFLSGKARGDLPWAEREIRRALIDPLGLDEGGGAPRA